jgi:hypothetical protein
VLLLTIIALVIVGAGGTYLLIRRRATTG